MLYRWWDFKFIIIRTIFHSWYLISEHQKQREVNALIPELVEFELAVYGTSVHINVLTQVINTHYAALNISPQRIARVLKRSNQSFSVGPGRYGPKTKLMMSPIKINEQRKQFSNLISDTQYELENNLPQTIEPEWWNDEIDSFGGDLTVELLPSVMFEMTGLLPEFNEDDTFIFD